MRSAARQLCSSLPAWGDMLCDSTKHDTWGVALVFFAGIYGSQGRADFTVDDVEHYFNYMGMLAVEGTYDRMEEMLSSGGWKTRHAQLPLHLLHR